MISTWPFRHVTLDGKDTGQNPDYFIGTFTGTFIGTFFGTSDSASASRSTGCGCATDKSAGVDGIFQAFKCSNVRGVHPCKLVNCKEYLYVCIDYSLQPRMKLGPPQFAIIMK